MQHVFQSYWIGTSLSPYEAIAMRSFIDHGHRFKLYCYSDRLRVPKGVELADASVILPREKCFAYRSGFGAGSFSACSNLFRYLLLRQRGGWWVDTDVVCLSSRIPDYTTFYALEDSDFINGAVLRFGADDPLLKACLGEASSAGEGVRWGELGPRLITRKARELGCFATAQPSSTCYPVHWSAALGVLDPRQTASIADAANDAMMLHLWNEIFRQANISKNLLPPEGSFLRRIADEHPVAGWRGHYVLPDDYMSNDLAASLVKHKTPAFTLGTHWGRDKIQQATRYFASLRPQT